MLGAERITLAARPCQKLFAARFSLLLCGSLGCEGSGRILPPPQPLGAGSAPPHPERGAGDAEEEERADSSARLGRWVPGELSLRCWSRVSPRAPGWGLRTVTPGIPRGGPQPGWLRASCPALRCGSAPAFLQNGEKRRRRLWMSSQPCGFYFYFFLFPFRNA